MAQPLPIPPPSPASDDIVLLRNASWADFERMCEMRGEHGVPRLAYLQGVIELMSPSRSHESIKSMIGCLLEAYCVEMGIELSPYGSWTHKSPAAERAAEPDECYVFGDVAEPARADLAIEVQWSQGGLDKLEIYRKLGVKELWIWRDGAITPFVLQGDHYEASSMSERLPELDLALLCRYVCVQPMTRAVREFLAQFR